MLINKEVFETLTAFCKTTNTTLIAVSKTKSNEAIQELYNLGQRDFGENYVQELVAKEAALPKDIKWHFIGHLQSNKVKYISPFVHMIHGVDSLKLYHEISKQAAKNKKVVQCLLQLHIAQESTKFGFSIEEANALNILEITNEFSPICGFMGMASFTDNEVQLKEEFTSLNKSFEMHKKKLTSSFNTISMGMSGDYELAVANGSNMIRVGSLLFGSR